MNLMNGPQTMSHEDRMILAHEMADRLHETYRERLLAIGLYGSLSRGTDGPYSDIEMFCVLRRSEEKVRFSHEWSAGPWKAEVNVVSEDVLHSEAYDIEGEWSLTHGPYHHAKALYDPENFFVALRQTAQSPDASAYQEAVEGILVGEMMEFAGKLRNIAHHGPRTYLPYLTMQFAQYGAMLIGLHHRKLYSTGAMVLPEAVSLPDRPAGYDAVAELVMSGNLADSDQLIAVCETFWHGLHVWAAEHGYAIHSKERIPF